MINEEYLVKVVHGVPIFSVLDDKSAAKTELNSSLFEHPFTSALQVFSSMGGLALLAEHLPTVYPETIRPPMPEKPPVERSDSDWVKVEGKFKGYPVLFYNVLLLLIHLKDTKRDCVVCF